MNMKYTPNDDALRVAAVGQSISNSGSLAYLVAIYTSQNDYDAIRRFTRTESPVRASMMRPDESGLYIVGTVVPHHPKRKTHYSTWIKYVSGLIYKLQNQLGEHNESQFRLTYLESKEQSVDRNLEDRLEFPVKFVPRVFHRHREDLDPFTNYLMLFASMAATIFRKDGDLVLSYPQGTEFDHIEIIEGYGIKDSLDAEMNRRLTKESLVRNLFEKFIVALKSGRL